MHRLEYADEDGGQWFIDLSTEFPVVRVGRDPDGEIVRTDPAISHYHAAFLLRDGVVVVADQESTNGTFLNGTLVREPTVLRGGDRVACGSATITYQASPADSSTRRESHSTSLELAAREATRDLSTVGSVGPVETANFRFSVRDAAGGVRHYELSGADPVLSVGRHPDRKIQLLDQLVSRHHCTIFGHGGDAYLEEVGSSNGTFLNGGQITGRAVLSHGDQIVCGDSFIAVTRNSGAFTEPERCIPPERSRLVPEPSMTTIEGRQATDVPSPPPERQAGLTVWGLTEDPAGTHEVACEGCAAVRRVSPERLPSPQTGVTFITSRFICPDCECPNRFRGHGVCPACQRPSMLRERPDEPIRRGAKRLLEFLVSGSDLLATGNAGGLARLGREFTVEASPGVGECSLCRGEMIFCPKCLTMQPNQLTGGGASMRCRHCGNKFRRPKLELPRLG